MKGSTLWHPWRLAGAGAAAVMSIVPRRRRFDAAVLFARPLVEILRRTPQYRLLDSTAFNSDADIALHLLLHTLTANGAAFDPLVRIDGYERFAAAHRRGRGVLLVAVHTPLVLLMLRRFHDDGMAPFVVAADPALRVAGTTVIADTVQPSANMLVQIRNRLRQGRLVCAMLDGGACPKPRMTEVDTPLGRVRFSPELLHVAARCGAAVAFSEAHLEGRRVHGAIAVGSAAGGAAVEQEYIDFIRSVIGRRAASAPIVRLERAAT